MINIYVQEFMEEKGRQKHQAEHEAGKKLLKKMLKEIYEVDDYVIESEPQGKPLLSSHPEIQFNISHSSHLVVCAAADTVLGVDVERIRPFRSQMIQKILSSEEQEMFSRKRMNEEEQRRLFFQLWTLKESYVKAVGCGIRMPLKSISFLLDQGKIQCSQKQYQFWQTELQNQYVLSVCWKNQDLPVTEKPYLTVMDTKGYSGNGWAYELMNRR